MIIVGAGGHALEVLDVLRRRGKYSDIFFFDDVNPDRYLIHGKYKVLKSIDEVKRVMRDQQDFCLGVGLPIVRKKLTDLFVNLGGKLVEVVGDNILSYFSRVKHVDIMDYAYVGPNSFVGVGSLLNTRASVHHDVCLGDFCEVSPGATILGGSKLGDYCFVGAGAVVLPKLNIGTNVVIAAGAVVTMNIPDNSMVVGVPAKKTKELEKIEI